MKVFMSCLCLTLLAMHIFAPDVMASAGSGSGLPYEDWLTTLKTSISGPFAFVVSFLGVVVCGATLVFGGDLNGFFRGVVVLVMAISFILAANSMMSTLFGQGSIIAVAPSTVQVWVG